MVLALKTTYLKQAYKRLLMKKKLSKKPHLIQNLKKPSGDESDFFIKTSLALSDYPYICFIALAIHSKLNKMQTFKFSNIKKFYIDTSTIIPIIQALTQLYSLLHPLLNKKQIQLPQIVNFKSYLNKHEIHDFNDDEVYTFMSASTSGNLRKKYDIYPNRCITIFHTRVDNNGLLELELDIGETVAKIIIPVTAEDFSLTYSKSEGIIIKQENIERLDKDDLISKILDLEFGEDEIEEQHLEDRSILYFDNISFFKNNSKGQ